MLQKCLFELLKTNLWTDCSVNGYNKVNEYNRMLLLSLYILANGPV